MVLRRRAAGLVPSEPLVSDDKLAEHRTTCGDPTAMLQPGVLRPPSRPDLQKKNLRTRKGPNARSFLS
jgi:hypothetical protein